MLFLKRLTIFLKCAKVYRCTRKNNYLYATPLLRGAMTGLDIIPPDYVSKRSKTDVQISAEVVDALLELHRVSSLKVYHC